jgi:hypothetical protein
MTHEDWDYLEEHSLYENERKNEKAPDHFAYVYEHDGNIIAAGGFQAITETTYWAWAQLTEFCDGNLVMAYRVIKEYMDIFCKENKVRRLQAWVRLGFEEGERMVGHLGFYYESTMHNFVDGMPAKLYVKHMEYKIDGTRPN